MEFNPIFKRESQVRFRSWRTFALLFCYAMSLACLLGWAYTDTAAADLAGAVSISEGGQQIFRAMEILQMAAWMLVVPILAASVVSAEREHGLLEALQLSGLTPMRIIGGKLAALIAFAILLMLAVAPVMGVCFMMGGVSPEEFLKSIVLQAMTILLCASAGLFFSAHARRSLAAFRNVMIALVLCGLGSGYALEIGNFIRQAIVSFPAPLDDAGEALTSALTILNPLRAQLAVFDGFDAYGLASTPIGNGFRFYHPHWFTLVAWLLCSLLLLCGAARGVERNFEMGQWMERKRYLSLRGGRFSWVAAQTPPAIAQQPVERTAIAVLEMPLAQLVHFQNPILQREVKGKLRMRRFHKRASLFMYIFAGIGLLAYVWSILWVLTEPKSRMTIWALMCGLSLFLISLAVPLMGAGALSRERENGTWEMLHLSLMEPRHIIFGKVLAPLVMAGSLFVLVMPLLVPCVRWLQIGEPKTGNDYGPALDCAILMLLMLAASAFFFSAWGLWLSWRCRSTVSAMALAIVSLLVFLIVVPVLVNWLAPHRNIEYEMAIWHPFFALGALLSPWDSSDNANQVLAYSAWHALRSIAVIFGMGCVILLDLNRRMNRAWRHAGKGSA